MSQFNLNCAGLAGFLGGEEAVSAMHTILLYEGRRWLGWYNSPGGYVIAKHFGWMASRDSDGNNPSATLFGLDEKQGPKYIAASSGTRMRTSHLGHLLMERSKELTAENINGRDARPVYVSYLAMKEVDYTKPLQRRPLKYPLFAIIPIAVSLVACILSALAYDWCSFSMILLGIIYNGWTSFVIGKGRLVIGSVGEPAKGSPTGNGILIEQDEVIVIKGEERDVNAITKGRFDLGTKLPGSDDKGVHGCHYVIRFSPLVPIVQFLFLAEGSPFGQIMFIFSLAVSWGYNSYLSSLAKKKMQTDILFDALGEPEIVRFRVGTRTAMTVFVCLLLFHDVKVPQGEERSCRENIIYSCIPNNTAVWQRWREKVIDQLVNLSDGSSPLTSLGEGRGEVSQGSDERLFVQLLDDARDAIREYFRVRDRLRDDHPDTHFHDQQSQGQS